MSDSDDDFMSGLSDEGFESLEEDFDDSEVEFPIDSQDKDILKPKRQAYEVPFKVLTPDEVGKQQDVIIDDINGFVDLPREMCSILIRHFKWKSPVLVEKYMDRPDETLESVGLDPDSMSTPTSKTIRNFSCDICCDEGTLETFAMKCGHRYCIGCYRAYTEHKIKDEAEAIRIQCPTEGCNRLLSPRVIDFLLDADMKQRYQTVLTRTYVDDMEQLRWCPAPNCEYAMECPIKKEQLSEIVPTVKCNCGHSFCFGCGLNDHLPTPCFLVKKWIKKCEDDSETANWISAHTKECPKCLSTIEKNGGCNHMTCRKCKHEFCWICMGLWSEHGTNWYNCGRYEEKSGSDARSAQEKSRATLERYLHYYNRYANHEQSAKLDKDIYVKTERKMVSLQASSGMSWIEVQFLEHASQALQQCRQTLKWTYAFAFYLEQNNLTHIFEDNQKDLELAVENLSEMFEKPPDQLAGLKVDMMDKTAYCLKRRVVLLNDTAENLKKGEWKFTVDAAAA